MVSRKHDLTFEGVELTWTGGLAKLNVKMSIEMMSECAGCSPCYIVHLISASDKYIDDTIPQLYGEAGLKAVLSRFTGQTNLGRLLFSIMLLV